MPSRFDADFTTTGIDFNSGIDAVFAELTSSFLTMPRGEAFLDYPTFESGYEALKKATNDFTNVTTDLLVRMVYDTPVTFVVIRSILGFTPPEWAYVTTERSHTEVSQGAARTLDRKMRLAGLAPISDKGNVSDARIKAMISVAVALLEEGTGDVDTSVIVHRLDKVDTAKGIRSLPPVADLGVPFPMLLYERFLGRPFATHRDAVSELVGDVVESAVEAVLYRGGVSNRKTKRAERIAGFDQAPDFIVPNEFNPAVVIEAKLTEDDGTARDKVSRVQNLRAIRDREAKNYEIVACIAGRGFKVRREDIRRLLEATDGKVFTLESIDRLLDCTRIREFVSRV